MLDFDPIELHAMQMLLAGEHPILEILRRQFDHCFVTERDFTGIGFFTSLTVSGCQAQIQPPRRIVINDVCADVDGLKFGCGFVLFIDDGLLGALECHLWGDVALPENARYSRLHYTEQPNYPNVDETATRNMEALNDKIGE